MNSQPQKINTLNHDTCHGLHVQFSTCQSLQYTRWYTNIAVQCPPFEGVLLVHQGGKLLPYILKHEQNLTQVMSCPLYLYPFFFGEKLSYLIPPPPK